MVFLLRPSYCDSATGHILVSVIGGTEPFSYSINGGIWYQSFSGFFELFPGSYQVVTVDYNGCTISKTVTVDALPYNRWAGSAGSEWENPANWSCNTVPVETSIVSINSGTVIINSNVTVYSLSIGPGVNFIVNPGYAVTVLH